MFDVFLAHNSQDKPLIRLIYRKLKSYGLNPWLDEEHIPPGTTFQDEIQKAITQVKSSAIFFGESGLGRWHDFELKAFISQCVERKIPVIPVLLPGVSKIPDNLLFLREFHAVTFKENTEDEQAAQNLYWGITGKKLEIEAKKPFDPSLIEDNLLSERAVDYRKLRELLKVRKWEEADKETMSKLAECCSGKKFLGLVAFIDRDQLRNIPCADLQTIDRLWVKYSNARFGFSIQRKVYLECHGNLPSSNEHWDFGKAFRRRVGWVREDRSGFLKPFQFTAEIPQGNLPILPSLLINGSGEYRSEGYELVLLRLEDCKPWYLDLV